MYLNHGHLKLLGLLGLAFGVSGAASCSSVADDSVAVSGQTCQVSRAQKSTMLALPFQQFDQDPAMGWRRLGETASCYLSAARLISDYRAANSARLAPIEARTLAWHEGQMWAASGNAPRAVARAVATFGASKEEGNLEANLYADATIAFVSGNRARFDQARTAYLAIAKPPGFDAESERVQREFGIPPLVWPLNAGVVNNLARCFGQPYLLAYAGEC
jgi:hypothetical protein